MLVSKIKKKDDTETSTYQIQRKLVERRVINVKNTNSIKIIKTYECFFNYENKLNTQLKS